MTATEGALKRDIGLVGAAFIALNGIIGAGIFAMPQTLVEGAGAFSPYFILLIGVLMIAVAGVMGELAGYFDKAGGVTVYATAAFGSFAGFQVGWLYYLARLGAFAANTNVLLTYLAAYAPVDEGALRVGVIALLTLALVAINIAGVKGAVRTLNFVTVLKVAPLIILAGWGLFAFAPTIPAPQWPADASGLGDISLVLLYAFVGFEMATLVSGETHDCKRNMPRALITTIVVMAVFYFLIQLAYVAVMQGAAPEGAPLAAAASVLAGPWGAAAITVAAIISIGGNLFASMIATPRLTFAMAEAGSLPAWLGQVSRRFSTPANSILLMGVIGGALAVSGAFIWLAAMSALARMVVYLTCIAALPKLRGEAPKQQRGAASHVWRMAAPLAAAALCLWAVAQAELDAWQFIAGFAAFGTLLYLLSRWRPRQPSPI
ncbi:MAG TPA: APC family permease [Vitreimonas sp.]|uniref:APC family permease n=1 Tax=Vitreimonas sp. TaxID=3069702 RepID=UPI002D66F536|nr:APC family permease [Vitreimonas sp.]HYD88401.1 APC family permease [Vitreimonas sp.]